VENSKSAWAQLGTRQRAGLAAGAFVIVAAAFVAGYFLLRPDYQVLFSDLAAQDAAAMVAELDRLKVPYRIEGETIFVPADQVHKTRMKLMAKDFPMHGAVGFELFNNADFGMTEFAQKVNYQRALQGELTRTIMAMDDVQGARVHIAMPEQGLFRKSAAKPKASITIAMKAGRTLRADQVTGIQRLVSSAIPDIAAQDVTIVDQRGIALTRAESGDGSAVDASNSRLDSKRAIEEYLARKVTDVLDKALGPGQAMATVDVRLNLDQTRVTTEDVLPAGAGANPAGVMVRQRQVLRDAAPLPAALPDVAHHESGGGNVEIDYQVGHRTEQVVSTPGAVQRLGVAVVLKAAADKAQLERIRDLVGVAVGYDSDRGDSVAVYSMDQLPASPSIAGDGASPDAAKAPASPGAITPAALADARSRATIIPEASWLAWILAAILVVATVAYARTRSLGRVEAKETKLLGSAEREAALAQVRDWLGSSQLPQEAKR